MFGSREIAVLFWGGIAAVWALRNEGVRAGFRDVLSTAMNRHVIGLFGFLGAWAAAEVLFLRSLGLWHMGLLKDTLIWFALAGAVFGFRAVTSYADPDYRRAVVDGFTIAAALEFVVAMEPFPLPVELVLVPVLGLVGIMTGLAGSKPEYASTKKFLTGLSAVFGTAILAGALYQLVGDLRGPAAGAVLEAFLLPPALTLLLLPAVFVLVVYARYEWLFGKLTGPFRYRTYARVRLATLLGPRPNAVLDFGRKYAYDLPHVRTMRELEEMMQNPPSREVNLEALRALANGQHSP